MRILHIDPDDVDNPLSGGGPVRTLEINRILARRHEITVLTPTFAGSTPELIRDGIRYVRLGRRIRNHGSSHHITFFFGLPRAVRTFDHDLLVEDFMPPFGVTANPLFTRKPVIGSVQWFDARALASQYRFPFHRFERPGLKLYRSLVTVSNATRRQLENRGSRATIEVIPNGVDETLFSVGERPGRSILYFGRVDLHRKGVGMLLDAYASLPPPRPKLIVAGFGYDWEAVHAKIAALGVGETVELPGRIGAEGRRRLLAECRFVCFPSREETFGMGITEACAAARPVVHFDLPPMNEIASGAGCLAVPAFDVGAYAAAMQALIEAPDEEVHARGLACRARVQTYRWNAIAARQETFYEERMAFERDRRR